MSNEKDNRNPFWGQILSMKIRSLESQLEASMLGIDALASIVRVEFLRC
jgi:hypothetical protein